MLTAAVIQMGVKSNSKNISTLLSCLRRTYVTKPEVTDDPSPDMPNLDFNPFAKEKPKCFLCYHNIEPTYKNVRFLSQFQSRHTGSIYPAAVTGLCKEKYKRVAEEISKAQRAGLMPMATKIPKYVNDPKLFDADRKLKINMHAID